MKLKAGIKNNGVLILCGIILFLLVICPLFTIFTKAIMYNNRLNLSRYMATITADKNVETISNSLLLGITVVLISTVFAAPLAYLTSRTELARHRWIDIMAMIPFMTPPFISSMGWILFVQRRGLLQQLLPMSGHISEYFLSFWGLSFVMALHVYPFMTTILKNAMLNIGTNLEEAGAVFGGGFSYRTRKLLIPLLTGNYAIGALLVFVKSLSEYGTPYTFGTRIGFTVFTTDIHKHSTTAPIDFNKAAALSSVLVTICLLIWYLQNYITKKKSYQTMTGKGLRVVKRKLSAGRKMAAWIYLSALLVLSIGIPYFSIISTSLIKLRGYGLAKGNFTIQHYIDLFTKNNKGIDAIITSLILAVSASLIAVAFGTAVAIAIHYSKHKRINKLVEAVSLISEMLPSIIIVIGLMIFWNKIYTWIPLYNTLGILILAYVVLYLPYTVQYVNSAFTQISESLIQAGRVFGGSKGYIFRRITLPLLFRGVFAGWMMTFIISFRELVAASMIAPPNTWTISTFIVREFEQGDVSIGMAMAVIYVMLSTGILLVLNTITNKKEELRI